MTRRWRVVGAAAVLMVAAGCGGGGGGGGSSAPAPSTTAADDQALAQRANLQLADFPTEWKSSPLAPGAVADSEASDRAFADCMGRPPPDQVRTARADSEDFSAQDTRRASSNVEVVRTVDIARDDFTAQRTDKALDCRKAQIDAEFQRQVPDAVPKTTIERLDLPQFGDQSLAFRVTAIGQVQGQQVTTYIDLAFVQKDRAELSGGFINRSTPFPPDLEKTLLQRMVGRA